MTSPVGEARHATAARAMLIAAGGAALMWVALVLAFGGLHFDDFVNLDESRGALALSAEEWRTPAADGRWQPLKRLTYDALARTAGTTFWPYALALALVHGLTVLGTVSAGRAIWRRDGASTVAGLIALASLNLSAYSIANVGTLHGMASVALSIWAASSALHAADAGRRRGWLLVLSVLATVGACLYKETGVTTPALTAYGLWLTARDRRLEHVAIVRAVGAPAVGVATYFLLRVMFDIQLFPAGGRYVAGASGFSIANLAIVFAGVIPWAAAALAGSVEGGRNGWRGTLVEIIALGTAVTAVVLPSLILPWTSPNFWYAAVPVAGLGTAALFSRAARPGHASAAVTLLIVLMLGVCAAVAWRAGAHHWGPYAESSITQWTTFPRNGGRIVWFDRDNRAPYGGLYRTIGPGDRLAHALRVASGDHTIRAVACVDLLVGPPCTIGQGDEIYIHSRGRLERVSAPPPGIWFVLP